MNSTLSFCQLNGQIALRKINEQNGLSDNNVTCVYKDKKDFVWIGTASGLNLMNGSSITVFKHDRHNTNSISNSFIKAITGDPGGRLWVGTKNGLDSYDATTNQFITYKLRPGNQDIVQCLASDKNGNLYVGTPSGLFYIDNRTREISSILLPGEKREYLLNHNITGLAIDSKGVVWFTTYNGLWSYNNNLHKAVQEATLDNDPSSTLLSCLQISHDGRIWMGTWDKGLMEFNPLTKEKTIYPFSKVITSVSEIKDADNGYVLWINGNFEGFNAATGKFIHFPIPYNFPKQMEVYNLYTSDDNWLWMGTKDGVCFYNPEKVLFRNHVFNKDITGQDVPLLEWNGKILAGGEDKNFLKLYNDSLQETADYDKYSFRSGHTECLSLAFSEKNNVKVGTNHGIIDIDLVTKKTSYDKMPYLANRSPSGNFITGLLKDSKNNWWIFPWRNGIWRKNDSGKIYQQACKNFISRGGYPKPLVVSEAMEDQHHNIWFADLEEGIILYDRKTNTFSKPFVKQLGVKITTPHLFYYKDYGYSFSDAKIFKWNTSDHSFQTIELPAQMDKPISAIAMDSIGHLWIATEQGLLVYNFITKKYERFTSSDGLVTNDMDGNLYCKKNGIMVFGSAGYLTSFNPGKLLNALTDVPHIKLAEVVVNGHAVYFDTAKTMEFGHLINRFNIKWAVTDYNNPLRNHYYYKLQGIDRDWHYAGNRGEVEFANLSPGSYYLLLKGENSNDISAGKVIALRFHIRFPFWQQWWFIGLVLLAIAAVLYALYRYRINQLLKIEKLRNKISLDLHDDIGSTLSSISILSEMALHPKNIAETGSMLREIKESSLSLMERMDDIVWSINPEKDSIESLLLRIKAFAAKIFEAKEINYTFHINENIRHLHLSMENRQHIYLLMKEAINNLVKYSACNRAEVYVDYHLSHLKIMIKDNGIGFNTQNISHGNGLNSMKKRAATMKGILDIHSVVKEGTTISFKVKIV